MHLSGKRRSLHLPGMSADPAAVASSSGPKSAEAAQSRGRGLVRILEGEALVVVATLLAPLLLLIPVLRLWRMNFRVPMVYWGDAVFYLMLAKNVVVHGSYLTNSSLGAPFGQQLYDFPQGGDNLNILVLRVIGLFTNDAALAVNLFYLLTYPLVALSALLVLRRFGMSRAAAFLSAVLFTMLPYHFWRGENHLFLSAYWAVPLGAYLTLVTLDGGALFAGRDGGRRLARGLSRTTLGTIAICIVVGSTGLYYGAFSALLILTAALVAGIVKRSRAVFLSGLAAAVVVSGVLVINLSPSLVYTWTHGKNTAVVDRQPQESEAYGLKLTKLLLPVDDHRIGLFARAASTYDRSTVIPENTVEAGQTLGTIGDVGFFVLLFVLFASCVAAARWRPPPVLQHASFATIAAFLFGTVSGFSAIFAYFVTSDLHAPARISVFIAFFSLLAVGVLLDAGARRFLPVARRARWLAVAVTALVLIGVADQTTNAFVPDWSGVQQSWRTDALFGQAVERALPRGSMVFELPVRRLSRIPAAWPHACLRQREALPAHERYPVELRINGRQGCELVIRRVHASPAGRRAGGRLRRLRRDRGGPRRVRRRRRCARARLAQGARSACRPQPRRAECALRPAAVPTDVGGPGGQAGRGCRRRRSPAPGQPRAEPGVLRSCSRAARKNGSGPTPRRSSCRSRTRGAPSNPSSSRRGSRRGPARRRSISRSPAGHIRI